MKGRSKLFCLLFAGGIFAGSAGCDVLILPGALAKLANSAIGDLTASEIRALSQIAVEVINSQAPGTGAIPLTEAQSQALVNFLDANNVQTFEELEALLNEAQGDPSAIQGLEELAAAFAGGDQEFDPDNPTQQDLEEIFSFAQQGGAN
ncbi:MAG: hypothetical protein HS101_13220 [Planctomycetia bacterium]|jgi:uncharacterized protein (DUF1778 family)|nr:hypothetical protein [Planctomycetia bacterium]MCC7313523.1 hypothetical protein [Planctomycetota bacterium]OQZ06672.1 MAG: hypothetical protein B6D36_03805 [Planctomycetes bacterium UTPLA1]